MNTIPPRIVIYAKDVMNITGRKSRASQKLLEKIRKHYNKSKDAFVSVEEFCSFTGLKEEKVNVFLR